MSPKLRQFSGTHIFVELPKPVRSVVRLDSRQTNLCCSSRMHDFILSHRTGSLVYSQKQLSSSERRSKGPHLLSQEYIKGPQKSHVASWWIRLARSPHQRFVWGVMYDSLWNERSVGMQRISDRKLYRYPVLRRKPGRDHKLQNFVRLEIFLSRKLPKADSSEKLPDSYRSESQLRPAAANCKEVSNECKPRA